MTAKEQGLPALPEGAMHMTDWMDGGAKVVETPYYTADQMRAYALAALASDTGERGVVAENERLKARLAEQNAAGFAWNGHMVHGDKASVQAVIDALRAQPAGGGSGMVEGFFAATPAEGSFDIFPTLDEAKARAMDFLEWERDEAADGGWRDEPPQVCYGIVLGRCEEVPGSRRPADPQTDPDQFTQIVDFRLTNLDRTALTQPQPVEGAEVFGYQVRCRHEPGGIPGDWSQWMHCEKDVYDEAVRGDGYAGRKIAEGRILWLIPPESGGQGEAVAEVCRPGHPRPDSATFVRLLHDNLPDGTKLYTHPPAQASEPANLGEFVIALLIAGGYVTQAKCDEARKIALSHGPYEMPQQASGAVTEALIVAMAENYEMVADEGYYTPNDHERTLLVDFAHEVAEALAQGGGNER